MFLPRLLTRRNLGLYDVHMNNTQVHHILTNTDHEAIVNALASWAVLHDTTLDEVLVVIEGVFTVATIEDDTITYVYARGKVEGSTIRATCKLYPGVDAYAEVVDDNHPMNALFLAYHCG